MLGQAGRSAEENAVSGANLTLNNNFTGVNDKFELSGTRKSNELRPASSAATRCLSGFGSVELLAAKK